MEKATILLQKQVGQRVRQLRQQKGLSQEALGLLAWGKKGKQGRVTNIESGRYRVDVGALDDLSRAMGVSLAELFFNHKQPVTREQVSLASLMSKQPAIIFDVLLPDDMLAPILMKGDVLEIDPAIKPKHGHRVIVIVGKSHPIIADYLRDSKTKKFFFRSLGRVNGDSSFFPERKNSTRIIGVVTGKRVSYL